MLHSQLAALALAAATLVASGCGSSKTGSTSATATAATSTATTAATTAKVTTAASTKPVTPADAVVIAKAGAICKRVRAKSKSINFRTARTLAYSIPRFAAYQQAAFTELHKLVPSASLAHEWHQFTTAAHTLASDINKIGQDAKTYHFAAERPVTASIVEDKARMIELAKQVAITGCEQLY
jgi:hypothetical protein